ncbi:hypothetical protein Cni_G12520 [Canna indica]|uniref:MADS box interactor-like n=1 Tax=Canna indica TaxID=4628 RepID=A0AAQ3K9Z2_9LILI|nr:hypothetical protein Cni_G12520 [Canna indica]
MKAAMMPAPAPPPPETRRARERTADAERVYVRRQALEAVLENCRKALQLLENPDVGLDPATPDKANAEDPPTMSRQEADEGESPLQSADDDEVCSLLKSKVESPDFLEKIGSIQQSVYQNIHDDNATWNMVTAMDLWEDAHIDGDNDSDRDGYVLVSQEEIVDSIACFMAAYLLSLKQTKELTPHQLQEALCKAFSVKKKKSRLRKAWEGSQVIYNFASWGATAVGVYHNPAILETASVAFWSSCRVISKLF